MYSLILIINILAGLGIIGLVLVQHGKGADMGAAFGSGSSGSLFGATGSSNFLSKTTGILAAVFFVTCLGLNYLAGHQPHASSVADTLKDAPVSDVPTPSSAPVPVPSSTPDGSRSKDIPK